MSSDAHFMLLMLEHMDSKWKASNAVYVEKKYAMYDFWPGLLVREGHYFDTLYVYVCHHPSPADDAGGGVHFHVDSTFSITDTVLNVK